MYKLTELAAQDVVTDDVLVLPFNMRQKSRFAAESVQGKSLAVFLARGQVLRSGTKLTGPDKVFILVQAADEEVSVVRSDDLLLFARACYHMGNRHTPLQIQAGEIRYLKDHVLDHMLEGLGLTVQHKLLAFEPESGAYHSHDH